MTPLDHETWVISRHLIFACVSTEKDSFCVHAPFTSIRTRAPCSLRLFSIELFFSLSFLATMTKTYINRSLSLLLGMTIMAGVMVQAFEFPNVFGNRQKPSIALRPPPSSSMETLVCAG